MEGQAEGRIYPDTDEEYLEFVRKHLSDLTPAKHEVIKGITPQVITESAKHLLNFEHSQKEIDGRETLIAQILALIKRNETLCIEAKVIAVTTACDIFVSVVFSNLLKEAALTPQARIIVLGFPSPSDPGGEKEVIN